jgi:hypothetical protein
MAQSRAAAYKDKAGRGSREDEGGAHGEIGIGTVTSRCESHAVAARCDPAHDRRRPRALRRWRVARIAAPVRWRRV